MKTLFFVWIFESIISLQSPKLALNKSMSAPDFEQRMDKLHPEVYRGSKWEFTIRFLK